MQGLVFPIRMPCERCWSRFHRSFRPAIICATTDASTRYPWRKVIVAGSARILLRIGRVCPAMGLNSLSCASANKGGNRPRRTAGGGTFVGGSSPARGSSKVEDSIRVGAVGSALVVVVVVFLAPGAALDTVLAGTCEGMLASQSSNVSHESSCCITGAVSSKEGSTAEPWLRLVDPNPLVVPMLPCSTKELGGEERLKSANRSTAAPAYVTEHITAILQKDEQRGLGLGCAGGRDPRPREHFSGSNLPRRQVDRAFPSNAQINYGIGAIFQHSQRGWYSVVVGWDNECRSCEHWIRQYDVVSLPKSRRR